jgi:uncharacterized protein YidB (DUF937 family)
MATTASILVRSDGLRSGAEREATGSLLDWLPHREASSGVQCSGCSMLKQRGEREEVGAWLSAHPSGGGRGAPTVVARGGEGGSGTAWRRQPAGSGPELAGTHGVHAAVQNRERRGGCLVTSQQQCGAATVEFILN